MSTLQRVLVYDSDESEPDGFYQIYVKEEKKKTVAVGLLDKQIKFHKVDITKQKEEEEKTESLEDNVKNTNLFVNPIKEIKNEETFDLKMDPFTGKPLDESEEQDQLINEEEVVQIKQTRERNKVEQEVDHNKLRPRVVNSGLDNLTISKLGPLKSFTDAEYKQYVETQGGKALLSFSKKSTVLIVNNRDKYLKDIQVAKKMFIKIVDEDEFYDFVVANQIKMLQRAFDLQKKSYQWIKNSNNIQKIISGMQWVNFNDCYKTITLKDIDTMCKIESGNNKETSNKEQSQKVEQQSKQPVIQKQFEQQQQIVKESTVYQLKHEYVTSKQPQMKAEPMFIEMYRPENYFVIQSSQLDQIKNSIKNNELILVSGPTGCGKTTLIELILKELKLQPYKGSTTAELMQLIKTGQLYSNQDKVIFIDDIEQFGEYPKLIKALQHRKNNRIVATCNSNYNPKLRIIKQTFKEVKLQQQNIKQILLHICQQERKKAGREKQQLSVQDINSLIDDLVMQCQQDLKQAINQLQFRLQFKTYNNQKIQIYKPINNFELTSNIFKGINPYECTQQYYQDPSMLHCFIIQNYQDYGNYQTRYLSYICNFLSSADVQIAKMFKQSDWSGYELACVNETYQISLASRYIVQSHRTQFPSTVINLREKPCDFYTSEQGLLTFEQNMEMLELGLNILDASFYLGIDEQDEEKCLDMGMGESIKDILQSRKLKFCIGSQKTKLVQWVVSQQELDIKGKIKKGKK